ncbi:MAG: N-acetyl sugar amidotransferase [Gammaproteobacteria bacterium]
MKYCRRCVTPESHPRINLPPDGICSACRAWDRREGVDWTERERRFREIAEWARENSHGYDCLVPVSGGKDSYWQVVTCLEYGLNPLTVTWRDPARLEIGQQNLDNLVRLGVDNIDNWINPDVERRFMRLSYENYAVPGIPKHMALYNIPLKFAVKFRIPLIVWGENDAIEYGNLEEESEGVDVNYEWLIRHGVTQGTTAEDWVGEHFSRREMTPYFAPEKEELKNNPVRGIYLGYFFPWDPVKTFEVAQKHGFRAPDSGPGWHTFDDVDSGFISIHHYLKWYKFGCTRLFDNLSIDIRAGRISREAAVEIIRERAPEIPHEDIRHFCEYLGITIERFYEVAESFRNHDIWTLRNGRWVIEDFIVPNWEGWEYPGETCAITAGGERN